MQLNMAKQQRMMAITQQAAQMTAQAQQYKYLRYFFVELILDPIWECTRARKMPNHWAILVMVGGESEACPRA